MKLQDQYAKGLIALGYTEHSSNTRKARYFYKSGSSCAHMWVGKSGSVRFGSTANFSHSIAATDLTKRAIARRAGGAS